jgi:hypothetical protein
MFWTLQQLQSWCTFCGDFKGWPNPNGRGAQRAAPQMGKLYQLCRTKKTRKRTCRPQNMVFGMFKIRIFACRQLQRVRIFA